MQSVGSVVMYVVRIVHFIFVSLEIGESSIGFAESAIVLMNSRKHFAICQNKHSALKELKFVKVYQRDGRLDHSS